MALAYYSLLVQIEFASSWRKSPEVLCRHWKRHTGYN
jgi:hypothetical protein